MVVSMVRLMASVNRLRERHLPTVMMIVEEMGYDHQYQGVFEVDERLDIQVCLPSFVRPIRRFVVIRYVTTVKRVVVVPVIVVLVLSMVSANHTQEHILPNLLILLQMDVFQAYF